MYALCTFVRQACLCNRHERHRNEEKTSIEAEEWETQREVADTCETDRLQEVNWHFSSIGLMATHPFTDLFGFFSYFLFHRKLLKFKSQLTSTHRTKTDKQINMCRIVGSNGLLCGLLFAANISHSTVSGFWIKMTKSDRGWPKSRQSKELKDFRQDIDCHTSPSSAFRFPLSPEVEKELNQSRLSFHFRLRGK